MSPGNRDDLIIVGRLDRALVRTHPVAAIAVRLDQSRADTLRRSCNDGNLLFATPWRSALRFREAAEHGGAKFSDGEMHEDREQGQRNVRNRKGPPGCRDSHNHLPNWIRRRNGCDD